MDNTDQNETRQQFWKRHVDARKQSGQTQRAYCREHKLDYQRFRYWQRKYACQTKLSGSSPECGGFIKVPTPVHSAGSDLSITLTNGLVLRGVDGNNLGIVCELLERLS